MHPRIFLLLLLLCTSSGLCLGQSGAQVLQSTLQKMGGTERWQALRSLELRYNEETQHSFNMLGQEIASEKIRKELKFYRYLDLYGFVDKDSADNLKIYWITTQDSTFFYTAHAKGIGDNYSFNIRNTSKIDSTLFHIQNIEFLPRLILDCLQGKVTYEYEGLKNVEGKEHHSFWLSYQGYSKLLHLLIGKDYMPYQYNRYESKQGELTKSITFVEYHLFEQMLFPKHLQQNTYQKQEVMGFQTQNNAISVLKLQSVKVNEAPPAEILKILKR